jgi:hypothetical protein
LISPGEKFEILKTPLKNLLLYFDGGLRGLAFTDRVSTDIPSTTHCALTKKLSANFYGEKQLYHKFHTVEEFPMMFFCEDPGDNLGRKFRIAINSGSRDNHSQQRPLLIKLAHAGIRSDRGRCNRRCSGLIHSRREIA